MFFLPNKLIRSFGGVSGEGIPEAEIEKDYQMGLLLNKMLIASRLAKVGPSRAWRGVKWDGGEVASDSSDTCITTNIQSSLVPASITCSHLLYILSFSSPHSLAP